MKMTTIKSRHLVLTSLVAVLAACGESSPEAAAPAATPATAQTQSSAANCPDEQGIAYICGIVNGEDLLLVGAKPWVLVSGMNGELANDAALNGKIHLVDPADRSWNVLFPGNAPVLEHDTEMFAACPGPLDVNNFSAHGLALKAVGGQAEQYWLYMTSHGAREAIEVFIIDAITAKPTIK